MKLIINFVVFVIVFSALKATEFSDEEIRMFLPFIRHWVPPPCPMNELYKTCTGKCSDCVQRGLCIVSKCEEGCDCAPRFFRVTPDGPCEPVANCPKPECGENEIFRECGPICETCTNMECHIISCDHKCYCKEGYLRNKEGICIPKEECPIRTRCTHSEEWAESGPTDEFCWLGKDDSMTNKTQDVPRCYCKDGYKRNLLGHCVNETVCPRIKCYGHEIYHECVPKCNTTCRNYGNPNCTEDDNCYQGCFCPAGYVMNDFRSCIEIEKCSLDIEQVKVIYTDESDESESSDILPTNDTVTATDSTQKNDTTEAEAEKIAEEEKITAVTTDGSTLIAATPTSATFISNTTAKEKPYKREKITLQKETKHENVAKEKDTKDIMKYEFAEYEDGFGNDDI